MASTSSNTLTEFELKKASWDQHRHRTHHYNCIRVYTEIMRKQYHPRTNPTALADSRDLYDRLTTILWKHVPGGNVIHSHVWSFQPRNLETLQPGKYVMSVDEEYTDPNIKARSEEEHAFLLDIVNQVEHKYMFELNKEQTT